MSANIEMLNERASGKKGIVSRELTGREMTEDG
jgi:hypothetical protein